MKKFERFIIYPLLIVALFYIISGQQIIISAENILDKLVVREIFVVNDRGQEVVNISANNGGGGSIWTLNKDGVVGTSMGSVSDGGIITTYNKDGVIGAFITSDDTGGLICTFNKNGAMGSDLAISLFLLPLFLIKMGQDGVIGNMMGSTDIGNGIVIFNQKGELLVEIIAGETEHGVINVYDKYGGECTSYSYKP
ncbi:hypothetical protein ES703_100912 [subsurface metagenome]